QRTGKFDPSRFRDRYQESLRELIEAKMEGLPTKPRESSIPAPVIDLMAALKRSLVQEPPVAKVAKTTKRANAAPDRRQRAMLALCSPAVGQHPAHWPSPNRHSRISAWIVMPD